MFRKSSLRIRVALLFALFGAGLSVLFSIVAFVIVQQIRHMLIDEVLRVELDEYAN